MEKILFGKLDSGTEIYKYTLKNKNAKLSLITFGAAISSFEVFGRDIIGGYDKFEDYLNDDSHQGATIGRVANRIKNASFTMDGTEYRLPKNDGENCLHGGNGFDRRAWEVTAITDDSITFKYVSEDGEEGFPSSLTVFVTYTLADTALMIDYEAIPDGKTPIALTNHSYFNLDGFGGTVLDHNVKIYAEKYTEVDSTLIPTGNHPSVKNTVFDLRSSKKIGAELSDDFAGYDHNFVLSPVEYKNFFGKSLGLVAEVSTTDLSMNVYTDQPGIQFYIGNFLGGAPDFKNGIKRVRHGAFCLETQTEPNCINSAIGFYSRGEKYRHTTVYEFCKAEKY